MAIRSELTSGRLLHDFAMWSTIACLNRIATSNWLMATVYSIIFTNMLFFFVYISVMCTLKYFSLPIATELTIDVTAQASFLSPFPMITICNENPLKRSAIESMEEFKDIALLMKQFELIALNKSTDDDFRLKEVRGFMHRQKRARLMLRLLMAKVSDEARRAAGYNYTELISECSYDKKTCSSLNFTTFLHNEFGNCYSFAIDGNATRPGRKEGLKMIMTVNQSPTDGGAFDFLPTTDAAAVWAVIHNSDEFPDFVRNGIRIAAGTQALVGLSKVEYSRVSRPYGNCSENGTERENYYENYTYTHSHCQASWLQLKAVEICGCADPLYRKNQSHTYCQTPEDMLCLRDLTHTISPATKKGPPLTDCPQPCAEIVYKKTITYSVYPSNKYLVAIGTQEQRGVLLDHQDGGRPGQCDDQSEFYDDNHRACTSTQNPTESTATASAMPSTTVTIGDTSTTTFIDSSTTTPMISREFCPNYRLPAQLTNELDQDAKDCQSDLKDLFRNPSFTIVTGWPCKSTKKCKSCVMMRHTTDPKAWPCKYDGYPDMCKNRNAAHALSDMKCDDFFAKFDLIPWGTPAPTFEWKVGKGPGDVDCGTISNCDAQIKCNYNQTTDGKTSPLLESELITVLASVGDTWPCMVTELARQMALDRIAGKTTTISPAPGTGSDTGPHLICAIAPILCPKQSGKRKKRATDTARKPASVAVDPPGFGPCEYANKNFRGAKECVKWYRLNGAVLHVFFENFQVHTYTQAATYTLVALLSDVAGHAGLWLGMSVISVVELIGFFGMWFMKCFFSKKIKIMEKDVVDGAIKRGREDKKMYET